LARFPKPEAGSPEPEFTMTALRPLVWGDDTQSLREVRDNETLAGIPSQGGGGTVGGDSPSLMAGGVALADGTVAAGDAVYLQLDGSGSLRCARASADDQGHTADALAALVAGNRVWFCQHGLVSGYSGLTPGGDVFLSVVPGDVTQTPPWEPGQSVQRLGVAITESIVLFVRGVSRLILED